jgi:hypothetical protein
MTLTQFRTFARWHRPAAKPIGPIYRPTPTPVIVACVLWALLGALWLPQSMPTASTPAAKPLRIPGAVCTFGQSMCAANRGLDELNRLAPGRYSLSCADGAQFPPVRVEMVSKAGGRS